VGVYHIVELAGTSECDVVCSIRVSIPFSMQHKRPEELH